MGRNDEEDVFEDANVYENITWKSIFKRRMSGCGTGFWFSKIAVKHYCQQAHKSLLYTRYFSLNEEEFNDSSLKILLSYKISISQNW